MSEPTPPSGNPYGAPEPGHPHAGGSWQWIPNPLPPGHPGHRTSPGGNPAQGSAFPPAPGTPYPGLPHPGYAPPPLYAPRRPPQVTRAFWLLLLSSVLQVAVLALTFAAFTTVPDSVFTTVLPALIGSLFGMLVSVVLALLVRSGWRFARIAVSGIAVLTLMGTVDNFLIGPAVGIASLLAVAPMGAAIFLLFRKPSDQFFHGTWAYRRDRLLRQL